MKHTPGYPQRSRQQKGPPVNASAKGGGKLRIIAGKYKSRRLSFNAVEGLRPTADAIRETLFNWLAQDIHQAKCLDVFAGSGALGFEALSRGAAHCTFLEKRDKAVQSLQQNAVLLECRQQLTLIHTDSLKWLNQPQTAFDLIFLDPPFGMGFIEQAIDCIEQNALLLPDGMLYLEMGRQEKVSLSEHWQPIKSKTAGQVTFGLFVYSPSP